MVPETDLRIIRVFDPEMDEYMIQESLVDVHIAVDEEVGGVDYVVPKVISRAHFFWGDRGVVEIVTDVTGKIVREYFYDDLEVIELPPELRRDAAVLMVVHQVSQENLMFDEFRYNGERLTEVNLRNTSSQQRDGADRLLAVQRKEVEVAGQKVIAEWCWEKSGGNWKHVEDKVVAVGAGGDETVGIRVLARQDGVVCVYQEWVGDNRAGWIKEEFYETSKEVGSVEVYAIRFGDGDGVGGGSSLELNLETMGEIDSQGRWKWLMARKNGAGAWVSLRRVVEEELETLCLVLGIYGRLIMVGETEDEDEVLVLAMSESGVAFFVAVDAEVYESWVYEAREARDGYERMNGEDELGTIGLGLVGDFDQDWGGGINDVEFGSMGWLK